MTPVFCFGETSATGATSGNPFQFTGRENDGTGLYYYRARYYSPSRSRFLSEDPLEFGAGDMNLYGYVFNSPTNFIDPTGERITIPGPIKQCLIGMLKVAGVDLAKRKPAGDPATLAQGCAGGSASAARSASVSFSQKSLQHNFRRAHLFGISGNQSNQTLATFQKALQQHIDSKSTAAIPGSFRGIQGTHYFDQGKNLNVFVDSKGNLVTSFSPTASQANHLLSTGKLGGG